MSLKLSKEKGIALIAGMLFIITVMIIVFSFILMIQTEVKEETVSEKFTSALYNGEAGLARTRWLLQHNPQWRINSLNNGTQTDLVGTLTSNGTYTVYLHLIEGRTDDDDERDAIAPGETIWEFMLPHIDPHGAYPYDVLYLDNGHILITEMHGQARDKGKVVELKPDFKNGGGKTVWIYNGNEKMTSAERMSNGNTLITEPHTPGRVYEIDPNGNKVWQWEYPYYDPTRSAETDSWIQDADELPDGNILITMRFNEYYYRTAPPEKDSVVVIDKKSKNIIWSYRAEFPTDADYLPPNGTSNAKILITEKKIGRIIEVDYGTKERKVIVEGLNNPYDAERLPNGHTVICESGGESYWDRSSKGRISEVDENGNMVGQPLKSGLSAPHGIDIVEQPNGDWDVLIANTDSDWARGNEIILIKGWSGRGKRVRIVSIGDYLGCKNTVIVEANLNLATGVLSNITWKEEKGVPEKYR